MIRLFLIGIDILILFIPIGLPAMLVIWLAGLFSASAKDRLALSYAKLIMRSICVLAGVRVNAVGAENIPAEGPVLFVANHRSYFDIFISYQFLTRPCGCVSKIEWSHYPLLKDWIRLLHGVFLDRSTARAGLESTKHIMDELSAGNCFWIYPEGTRNHEDAMLPFKDGSFRAAFRSGCPILPVTMVGTDDIYEKHRPIVKPGEVTICFGKPIETKELDRPAQKALIQEIHQQIQSTYDSYLQNS